MAGLKEIKRRLKSVKNTKKITYAMKLVSAAKLQKVQEKVVASSRYLEVLTDIFSKVLNSLENKNLNFSLLEKREEIKTVRLVIIGGSRGLCGGFNSNLNKKIKQTLDELKAQYPDSNIETYIIGKKVVEYFKRVKITPTKIIDKDEKAKDGVSEYPIEEIMQTMKEDYINKKVDKVYFLYTKFKSALSVTPTLDEVLPLKSSDVLNNKKYDASLIVYEPKNEELLEKLLPKFLKIKVLQIVLDSVASENGCRMTAMDSATNNANDLMARLQLNYNKLRQNAITSELLDIIGGAEALK